MTISFYDMLLYAGALIILFMTPGPVWVALLARSLSGGLQAAWPLALGVAIGDILWPLVAVLGVAWLVSEFAGFMDLLKYVAVLVFMLMGAALIRNADHALDANSRLTRPGMWAGFLAGVAVIIGNPKAVRAVGGANGNNPIPIIIPCHRVIGSNGTLTGFGGGIDTKRYLLDLERSNSGLFTPAAARAVTSGSSRI